MARNGGLMVVFGGAEEDVDFGLDVGVFSINDRKDASSECMELLEVGNDECEVQRSLCLT